MTPRRYGDIAALLLVAAAAYAVVHLLVGARFWQFSPWFNVAFDLVFAIACIAAAVAIEMRRTFLGLFVAMGGAATLLMVGLTYSVISHGTGLGVPFMAAAVAVAFALKRTTPAWDEATDEAHAEHAHPFWLRRRHRQPA
jgi:hypothetical protein